MILPFLLAAMLAADDALQDARALLKRGLLRQAEAGLLAVLATGPERRGQAQAWLLLGNIDYERGSYARAAERYVAVEVLAAGDPELASAARDNRRMADERLARADALASRAALLRTGVLGALVLGGAIVAGLGRRSNPRLPPGR